MNSRLPDATEKALRKLCAEYPQNKELIDDALEESIDLGCIKAIREDIALRRGYANSPINKYMCEVSYKQEKFRAKICLCQRFNLPIE